jgi:hypothetical protein
MNKFKFKVQLHVDLEMKMSEKFLEKVNEMEYTEIFGEVICSNRFGAVRLEYLINYFSLL